MRTPRTLLPLASTLLLWACGDGDAAPKAEDTPLPAEATQGADQGLPNPDAAQPTPEDGSPERAPRPAPPPATTETTLDDPPPEMVSPSEPVTPPADPDNPGGLPPGESVDAPPPPEEPPEEPTEPMA